MTIERVASEEFNATAVSVAEALVVILDQGQPTYQYRDCEFSDSGMTIATVIRPNWWPLLMSTRLYIQVEPRDVNLTVVTAHTKSQWFIMGDVFNFYLGYLNDMLGSLRGKCARAT